MCGVGCSIWMPISKRWIGSAGCCGVSSTIRNARRLLGLAYHQSHPPRILTTTPVPSHWFHKLARDSAIRKMGVKVGQFELATVVELLALRGYKVIGVEMGLNV